MPRSFSAEEKETIRKTLLTRGTELFSLYGLRKCSVEEIARAAGIAKGTFYLFHHSKEEFFFTCMERLEQELQQKEILPLLSGSEPLAEKLENLLLFQFRMADDYPFFRHLFNREEYAALLRALPPERLAAHLEEDNREMELFIKALTGKEVSPGLRGELLNGLFRATVLLNLHREEIGSAIFDEVTALMAHALAAGLARIITEGEHP